MQNNLKSLHETSTVSSPEGVSKKTPARRLGKKALRQWWRERLTELHFKEKEKQLEKEYRQYELK